MKISSKTEYYTLHPGQFVHFDMPGCGYGVVVGITREPDEAGQLHRITHMLWMCGSWSEIEDLYIPHGDPCWRVVLPELSPMQFSEAKRVWRLMTGDADDLMPGIDPRLASDQAQTAVTTLH